MKLPELDFRKKRGLNDWEKGYLSGMHDLIFHAVCRDKINKECYSQLLDIFESCKKSDNLSPDD